MCTFIRIDACVNSCSKAALTSQGAERNRIQTIEEEETGKRKLVSKRVNGLLMCVLACACLRLEMCVSMCECKWGRPRLSQSHKQHTLSDMASRHKTERGRGEGARQILGGGGRVCVFACELVCLPCTAFSLDMYGDQTGRVTRCRKRGGGWWWWEEEEERGDGKRGNRGGGKSFYC